MIKAIRKETTGPPIPVDIKKMRPKRPLGVTIIAILTMIGGLAFLVSGVSTYG